jgi:hypothetical protein
MSYTITFTNGKTLAVIADQSIDEVSTSLTLVGKNTNNYGSYFNTNFVRLLENFANLVEPVSPVVGQTWFDTSEGRLKVYNTGTFKPVGGPTVSNVEPAGSVRGDLWLDTVAGVLKWYDGSTWVNAGKQYSNDTGKEGWLVETFADITNSDVPLSIYYSNGRAVAAMTDDQIDFNPEAGFYIFTSTVTTLYPGVTLNPTIPGIKFYGTATSAELIAGGLDTNSFIRNNQYQETTGSLAIVNNDGLEIGTASNIVLYVRNTLYTATSVILGAIQGESLELRYNSVSQGTGAVAVHIDSINDRVGILTDDPQDDIDLAGNVTIRGNLDILGAQSYIESTTLRVNDKNIELGVTAGVTATNALADGGGIILYGTTNHTLLYSRNQQAWESNISYNINNTFSTSSYRIDGDSVIERDINNPTYYRLGARVLSAPGLTQLPVLSLLTVTNLTLTSNYIQSDPFNDINLVPGTGLVNLTTVIAGTTTTAKIVGMGQTVDGDSGSTAVTKQYFEDKIALSLGGYVGRKPYTLSLDITDFQNINDEIIAYLDLAIPVDGYGNPYYAQPTGSRCTVLCTRYDATTATYVLNNLNTSTIKTLINYVTGVSFTSTNTVSSYISTVSNTSTLVVTDFNLAGNVTIATPMPRITRTVKLFVVDNGYWTFVEDVDNNFMISNSTATITTGTKTFTVNNKKAAFENTGTSVVIRETDTQVNFLQGTISSWGTGTNINDMTVSITSAFDTADTSTYGSWIIRIA